MNTGADTLVLRDLFPPWEIVLVRYRPVSGQPGAISSGPGAIFFLPWAVPFGAAVLSSPSIVTGETLPATQINLIWNW